MTPFERIQHLGGAARFSEIGASRYHLNRLVARGVLTQPARGCYAVPGAPADLVAAVLSNTLVSCVSALRVYDKEIPRGNAVSLHVSAPPSRGHRADQAGVRVHYEQAERRGELRLVSLQDAAARAAQCQSYDSAVAILDRLTHRHGQPFLDDVLHRIRTRRPARAAALRLDVDGRTRSPIETAVRLHLRRSGFAVAAAPVVPGVGEVDFVVEGALIVELDGFQFHSDRRAFKQDRRRDRQALRYGFPTMRFAFEDCDPARIQREITPVCESLRLAPLRPRPDLPVEFLTFLQQERESWTDPSAFATGWRHLTGLDAREVRRTMGPGVPWTAASPGRPESALAGKAPRVPR